MERNVDEENLETAMMNSLSIDREAAEVDNVTTGVAGADWGGDDHAIALQKMSMLTKSQLDMIAEYLGISGPTDDLLGSILRWRISNDDFLPSEDYVSTSDEQISMEFLPSEDYVSTLQECGHLFHIFDLQLECLLRAIPYRGFHTHQHLINLLIDHQSKEELRNTFEILQKEAEENL